MTPRHRHLLVAERLRLRRHELGLTQEEVAARLRQLGVETTNKALSSLEHGVGLDVAKLPELARVLDCTLTWLVGLASDPRQWEPDERSWPAGARRERSPAHSVVVPGDGPWILGPVRGVPSAQG